MSFTKDIAICSLFTEFDLGCHITFQPFDEASQLGSGPKDDPKQASNPQIWERASWTHPVRCMLQNLSVRRRDQLSEYLKYRLLVKARVGPI